MSLREHFDKIIEVLPNVLVFQPKLLDHIRSELAYFDTITFNSGALGIEHFLHRSDGEIFALGFLRSRRLKFQWADKLVVCLHIDQSLGKLFGRLHVT